MRNEVIVILLLILISAAVLLFYTRKSSPEGFEETVANKIQDRANPLAAPINPRMNPSADYGIPEQTDSPNDVDATYLRELNLAALNIPLEQRNTNSDISLSPNTIRLSPRLDNENSFLGIVKLCKEKMENLNPGENPFLDPEFNKYCGVCMADGNYITGEQFKEFDNKKGAGVVVYQEDKKRAKDKQDRYKYKYPRAIPSLDAAQCTGASMNNDEDAPVLAIGAGMYEDMLRRKMCQENKQYDANHTCGTCKVETSIPIWSYVKNARSTPAGPNNSIYLDLYGLGKVNITVNIDGRAVPLKNDDGTPMGDTTLQFNQKTRFDLMKLMGGVKPVENDVVSVTLKSINGGVPYFGGFLRGDAPPQGTETKIQLHKVLERSNAVGRGDPISAEGEDLVTFGPVPETLQEIKASFFIPFTLIASKWEAEQPQIGFFDCRNNAYLTSTKSVKAFNFTDQCQADEEEGTLSNFCVTGILAEQKCSSAGEWWKDPRNLAVRAGGETRAAVTAYINGIKNDPKMAMEYEKGCLGRDTSSKCDPYLNDPTRRDVSPECLSEVYNNQLTKNPRLAGGAGVIYKEKFTDAGFFSGLRSMVGSFFGSHEHYADYDLNFQSLDKNTPQFCRPEGKLNPKTSEILKNVAATGGIDAVKKFLQDTYIRAIDSSLDINIPDPGLSGAGRKTSWENCFGIDLVAPRIVNVRDAPKAPAELLLAGGGNFNCTTTRPLGNPVYIAGAVARVGSGVTWNSGWALNAPPMTGDVKCYWIGAEPSYMTRSTPGKTYTYKFNFCNPYGFQIDEAYLVGAIDDTGSVKFNGKTEWTGGVAIKDPIKITIRGMNSVNTTVQQNTIEVECNNGGEISNPSGIWLAIYAIIGGEKKWLVTTNENWVYT